MAALNSASVVRPLCQLTAGCIVLTLTGVWATAADVVVHLKDGRTVAGNIDARTSNTHLWLRSAEPAILLQSRFAWDDVASARYDSQTLTAQQLKPLAMKQKPKVEPQFVVRPQPGLAAGSPASLGEVSFEPLPLSAVDLRIASVHVDASVANWDNDPEDDGLLVSVFPLTTDGRMRPVDGLLTLKLFGRVNRPSLNRPHFPELTRNTLRVRAIDFGPDGALYKFPFRNFHPEQNLDIDVFGLLSGRLVVAGQGAFDASDANVRLRRLSRFRDRLQLQQGRRYLPAENRRRLP